MKCFESLKDLQKHKEESNEKINKHHWKASVHVTMLLDAFFGALPSNFFSPYDSICPSSTVVKEEVHIGKT